MLGDGGKLLLKGFCLAMVAMVALLRPKIVGFIFFCRKLFMKPHSKSEVDGKSKGTKGEKVKKSTVPQEKVSTDANEEKNKKKWKRKQANDLRFEAGMEKLDGVSTRKQRKKE
ncbi:uncharacterized protein LOC110704772 [Chenopodium quinoa]|uniref:uncharacterized protein LOC110704772 n=1 Tax=Chenopodium quinoa TaxID=63459 RepID=UPI000B78F249|nr:uncharacterized protein LOC110704772 [Chenopodium quinoa]